MDFDTVLFQEWSAIVRTALVGVLAYVGLVAFRRISGKRTLSKLNAFDLVVTVALGSTLAAILLQENVALAEGSPRLPCSSLFNGPSHSAPFVRTCSPALCGLNRLSW